MGPLLASTQAPHASTQLPQLMETLKTHPRCLKTPCLPRRRSYFLATQPRPGYTNRSLFTDSVLGLSSMRQSLVEYLTEHLDRRSSLIKDGYRILPMSDDEPPTHKPHQQLRRDCRPSLPNIKYRIFPLISAVEQFLRKSNKDSSCVSNRNKNGIRKHEMGITNTRSSAGRMELAADGERSTSRLPNLGSLASQSKRKSGLLMFPSCDTSARTGCASTFEGDSFVRTNPNIQRHHRKKSKSPKRVKRKEVTLTLSGGSRQKPHDRKAENGPNSSQAKQRSRERGLGRRSSFSSCKCPYYFNTLKKLGRLLTSEDSLLSPRGKVHSPSAEKPVHKSMYRGCEPGDRLRRTSAPKGLNSKQEHCFTPPEMPIKTAVKDRVNRNSATRRVWFDCCPEASADSGPFKDAPSPFYSGLKRSGTLPLLSAKLSPRSGCSRQRRSQRSSGSSLSSDVFSLSTRSSERWPTPPGYELLISDEEC